MFNMIASILSVFSTSRSTRYKFAGQVYGHQDYIYALAISQDGSFLTSGGEPVYSYLKDDSTYCTQVLEVFECGIPQTADRYKSQSTVWSNEVPCIVSSGLHIAKTHLTCSVLAPAWDI